MNSATGFAQLSTLVDPAEIISPSSPNYIANTETWSSSKDKHPQIVLRPTTIDSLSKVIKYLSQTDLEYKVRSQGYGSASASDVLISLSAFDDLEFNEKDEYVTLGAGGNWASYYDRMQAAAPGWSIVPCRTPCIGIGGSTLCSGFSWLSAEYGCASDPANLLDARVVTADGEVKWASSDPDLLWAMRGTETGFAIATQFKFRARPYPENGSIWAGPILIPRGKVDDVAKGIMTMVRRGEEGQMSPKVSMFLYVLRKELLYSLGVDQDVLVIHAHDSRGEKTGREEFKWALEMGGAIDQTKAGLTQRQVAGLQEHLNDIRGKAVSYWSPIAFSKADPLTEAVILKAFKWWGTMGAEPTSVAENGYLLFELFSCRDSLTGRHSSAWPRPPGYKHLMLMGTGCAKGGSQAEMAKAEEYIIEGSKQIMGKSIGEVDVVPNCLEVFHNIERIYGEHYGKLREVKRRVDPHNRLQGWIRP